MNTVYATLEQVLEFRDRRCEIQHNMLKTYKLPMVSLTMNIAGPIKRSRLIEFAFDEAVKQIVSGMGEPVCYKEVRCQAGCEAFFPYNIRAEILKQRGIQIEEGLPIGRLLDIDILTTEGNKLSRQAERRCLVCGGPVGNCARSRAHPLNEIVDCTNEILSKFMQTRLAELAVQALLDEVALTPKPGLVDRNNSGAHRDMDITLMEKSAHALKDYFNLAAELGFLLKGECSQELQKAGMDAETKMYATTGGVNTHKGAIFSLGLLCAAAGGYFSGFGEQIVENAAFIAARLSPSKLKSHGEVVRKRYSVGGAREEALSGFPHVKAALDMLESGGSKYMALLKLMEELPDSNLLWRGGMEGLLFVQRRAGEILNCPRDKHEAMLRQLDNECIEKNLSPGGAADLLADTLFLYSLSHNPVNLT